MRRLIWRLRLALFNYRTPPRHDADPNFLFSTWPIPLWTGHRSEMLVTGADSRITSADFVYDGPKDQPRLQQILDRLSAVGGAVTMLEGNYVLSGTLNVGGRDSLIMGCHFVLDDSFNT